MKNLFEERPMPQRNDAAIWSGLFRISAESGQTLQAQIRQAIVAAILDRQIAASMPLPSCRILAEKLGVARGTVVLAFQQLVDQGFLIARERRGHFVNPEVLASPARPHLKAVEPVAGIDQQSDRWAVEQHWVSLTPISLDVTDEAALTVLRRSHPLDSLVAAKTSPPVSSAAEAAQVREDEAHTPGPDAIRPAHGRSAGE
jgi:DNA-binding transcriptional regulator YhcF (GntR family)